MDESYKPIYTGSISQEVHAKRLAETHKRLESLEQKLNRKQFLIDYVLARAATELSYLDPGNAVKSANKAYDLIIDLSKHKEQ